MFFKLVRFEVTNWSDGDYEEGLSYLQKSEVERAKKFHHLVDAKRSTSSHIIVKSILSKLHKKRIQNIEFTRTKQNRPFWLDYDKKNYPGLNFNVSHSGDWSVGVVCSHAMCGLDVQEIKIPGRDKSLAKFIRCMKHCFTFKEVCTMCLFPSSRFNSLTQKDVDLFLDHWMTEKKEELVKKRFFSFWVLKESFIKMLGTGIYFDPLSRVEFIFEDLPADDLLDGKQPKVYVDGKYKPELSSRTFSFGGDHAAALSMCPLNFSYIHENVKNTLLVDKSLKLCDVDEARREMKKSFLKVDFETLSSPFVL